MDDKRKLMRADEAQVALLDKMLEEIKRVSKESHETTETLKKQVPEGIIEPLDIVTATTVPQIITPPLRKPWRSVSVVNDGTNNCWIIVNTEKSSTKPYDLHVGETFEVDFGIAVIDDLYVHTDAGSASLRIRGVR